MGVTATGQARDERGFSLVEVIVAIGVMASVMISISSMFVLGGRQVKAGKTMTEATTLVHDMMETFDQQSYTSLYLNLGATGAQSTHFEDTNAVGSKIAAWQPEITRKLENGWARVTILAVGPGTPTFATAAGIRLTTELQWTELGRQQTVRISTVRF
jgi:prepilin-type N-terminal cleavage/methylation domain-containing protein